MLGAALFRQGPGAGTEDDPVQINFEPVCTEEELAIALTLSEAEIWDAIAEQETWLSEHYRTPEGRALARENAEWARSWVAYCLRQAAPRSAPLVHRANGGQRSPRQHGRARARVPTGDGSEPPLPEFVARLLRAPARLREDRP